QKPGRSDQGLSPALSLTLSLAAVMVERCTRYYVRRTRSVSSLTERAKMHQFLYEGMQHRKRDSRSNNFGTSAHSLVLFHPSQCLGCILNHWFHDIHGYI
ncbi:hypothetical protein BD410DRAFT_781600, partial [Rickenella mellea]